MKREDIDQALDWRYATKRFDAQKKLSEADWNLLTDSLIKAPSSYGLQPWKFLVIENKEVREKLKAVSWKQGQVTDASHFVVFLAKEQIFETDVDHYLNRIREVRGVSSESLSAYRELIVKNVVHGKGREALPWSNRQAYIAMGFLLETAALLEVDATPMEGLDPAAYDEILDLGGSGWKTVAAVALGYRHAEDPYQHAKKVRFKNEEVIQYRR